MGENGEMIDARLSLILYKKKGKIGTSGSRKGKKGKMPGDDGRLNGPSWLVARRSKAGGFTSHSGREGGGKFPEKDFGRPMPSGAAVLVPRQVKPRIIGKSD